MNASGGGGAAIRKHKCTPVTTEGPMGGGPYNHHCKPRAVRPVMSLHSKPEVPSGGKLDVEDVDRRETYLGMMGLHTREEKEGFIKCGY